MNLNIYTGGTLVRETGSFFDVGGELADPTSVILQYQIGGGSVTEVSLSGGQVIRDSQGVYHYDIDTSGWTGPGTATVTVQWTGAGNVQARSVDYFEVAAPPITPP